MPLPDKPCTIGVPLSNYQKLPMGLCHSLDIFQEKMNEFLNALEYDKAEIDDLLIIRNSNLEDCLNKYKL